MSQDLPNQDRELQMESDQLLRDLAEAGRSSLFIFANGILGYKDMTKACHGPLCEFIDQHPGRFKMIQMPRDHFKTSVVTIAGNLQKVIRNPEERILIANETGTNAERFLGAIKAHAESNRVFHTVYSDLIPKDLKNHSPWNNKELLFLRRGTYPEPTLDAIGMTGTMTSRHYTHMTFDDPISEEAIKSDKVMEDTINRIVKLISLFVKPERDTFWLVGTRWAFHDVYSFFEKTYGNRLSKFIRGAIEDGVPIFPELISLDTLALIRETYGEYAFSCLYMNNPRNSDVQDFNVEDFRTWRWSADEENIILYTRNGEIHDIVEVDKLDITTTVDLAVSEKVASDRNAIVTCGVTPNGDAVVLDVFAKRCTPIVVMEKLFQLQKRFHPRTFGIEGVAYQKAFKYFLKAECERRGVYMNIREITASGKKEVRIRGLQPVAATGHLYILPTMHELKNEFAEFPLGKHDDIADALSMQLQVWRGVMSPSRWSKYKASEERLLRRINGYGLNPESDEEDDEDFRPAPPIWEVS